MPSIGQLPEWIQIAIFTDMIRQFVIICLCYRPTYSQTALFLVLVINREDYYY